MPALYAKLDRVIGHFRRYTRHALCHAVEAAGFRNPQIKYMDMLGVAPWYLINTLLGSTKLNPRMVALYDALGIPLTRRFEMAIDPPFGKNLILVAIKN